ncbi:hypothetical protein FSOLCH5_008784 [Fusarium solani]|uniref:uncharacterized protein n=1 Tax=Fusarium solani TaxID=169388 RepID=UPI002312AD2C|nr:hypothetical protein MRS44_009512 [Fusarium solani]KAJ4207092.1 hypothetical protein NW759_014090 [Fusarium solani]
MTSETSEKEHKATFPPDVVEENTADDLLANLGYKPELNRNRSTLQVAFMSFVLASIPWGLSTTVTYPIIGGGPVNIIWGWLAVSLIILCVAASLGEITSVYPTAGGVYYQAFIIAPARWRRVASWICGWLYVVGNITITLSVTFGSTTFIISCINVFETKAGEPVFGDEPYKTILLFIGITLLCNAVSALGNRWLPILDTAAIFWTFAGVIAIVSTILAMSKNGRRDPSWVFTHFENNSGWPDGWSFCVGLLHAAYATSSTGMIISMCEEVRKPATQVPRAMVATIVINLCAGLLFLIPIVFVMPDISELLTLAQPVPYIIKSAVGSSGGAFGLLFPLMVLSVLCGISCTTATSRCVWSFARDGGIPGAVWWSKVNKSLDLPLNAMMLAMVCEILLGFIYFGSSAAFNAFGGVGVICLTAAYATPIGISLFTGRKQVKKGSFYLGNFGVFTNVVAIGVYLSVPISHKFTSSPRLVAWSLLALPLFCMPSVLPVDQTTVNYAPVVFVAATAISGIWYWVWGYENYVGPPDAGDHN